MKTQNGIELPLHKHVDFWKEKFYFKNFSISFHTNQSLQLFQILKKGEDKSLFRDTLRAVFIVLGTKSQGLSLWDMVMLGSCIIVLYDVFEMNYKEFCYLKKNEIFIGLRQRKTEKVDFWNR